MKEIRTRIAPSPTGMMHLGTARTAIYCWAVARHFGGKFLLRIEDTDQVRSTKEAVQVILDGMKWLNLDYDEGPVYQMDRLARYQEVVDEMLADGRAYYCYATPEELDALREQQRAAGLKPRYDGRWRPENCVGRPIPEGVKPVIRFRNPDEGSVTWNDAVYGPITVSNAELDDLIIMRNGIPTYNFAVVVDDWDMKVSHVIRGADHINNTPRQINIYKPWARKFRFLRTSRSSADKTVRSFRSAMARFLCLNTKNRAICPKRSSITSRASAGAMGIWRNSRVKSLPKCSTSPTARELPPALTGRSSNGLTVST